VIVAAVVLVFAWRLIAGARRRADAGLAFMSNRGIAWRVVVLALVLAVPTWYLYQNAARGIGAMFLAFLALVVIMHLALTRTRWGRAVYAVGGNADAASRAGIRVTRIYTSVFVLCSTFAAIGGVFAAARLAGATQSSGGSVETNLYAIAAAVIGGTSLFGGRGSAFSALLGIVVIMSISNGLTLLNLDSSVRYMITGTVLVLAVIVDSLSRRSRKAAGRA